MRARNPYHQPMIVNLNALTHRISDTPFGPITPYYEFATQRQYVASRAEDTAEESDITRITAGCAVLDHRHKFMRFRHAF